MRRREPDSYYRAPRAIVYRGCRLVPLTIKGAHAAVVQCTVRTRWAHTNSAPGEHHMLEHVLISGGWRGCGERPCSEYLADYTVSTNASVTGNEATYVASGPTDQVRTMLDFITGITLDPLITRASLERERPAVRAEMTPKAGSASRLFTQEAVNHLYSCSSLVHSASPSLHLKHLNKITVQGLRTLYARSYVRRCMTFIVASSLPRSQVLAVFQGCIDSIHSLPPLGSPAPLCRILPSRFARVKTKDKQSRILMFFESSLSPSNQRFQLLPFILHLLAGGLEAFLYTVLRSRLRKVYSVSAGSMQVGKKTGVWIQTSCAPKDRESTLEALVAAMSVARQGAVPPESIQRAKKSYILKLKAACWDSPGQLVGYYAPQFAVRAESVLAPARLLTLVEGISEPEVAFLCRAIFPVDKCTVVLGAPSSLRAKRGTRRTIAKVLKTGNYTRRIRTRN